ncbi:Ig-like group 1 domain-containing protein [Oxalobacteraceae bacterium OM1]|nr:Ig-like group 1 domain-containing protein [Oxalobacteraceae bacterium OM1]
MNLKASSLFHRFLRAATGMLTSVALVSCGGGGGSPGTVLGSTSNNVGSISILFSSAELKSAGTAGTEVTVTALVKTANNIAVADVPVTFTASSGALSNVDAKTDKNGQAKALLGTAGDRTNRRITVTVKAGEQTASGTVDVVNTTVTIVGPGTISAGGTGDFTVSVKDSSNNAVANVPVTFASQKGNGIAVKTSNGGSSSAPLTNSLGQVVLTVTASQSGTDTLSVSAQGTSASVPVNVNAAKISVAMVDSQNNATSQALTTTSCTKVVSRYEVNNVGQSGSVNLTTSRGKLYSDSTCATQLASSAVNLVSGDSQPVYLKSDTAGVATVTATVPGGPSAQGNLEFVAALTSQATITLQADPAVIGTNSANGQTEKSTITAIVRDGSAFNNFVKNAVVEFSIVADGSGGTLSDASPVITAANGTASVLFVAGTADTPKNGVVIQAKIQGTSISATTALTVSKKSISIQAGTGNTISAPTNASYQQDYSVVITDVAGNPVPNVAITASVNPTRYAKGYYVYDTANKAWARQGVSVCLNEDVNHNGILDAGEDTNGSGVLEPGLPVSVTASSTTDANGQAKVSLTYPKDRGNWVEVQLTIRGTVSGTEATYQTAAYFLPVLATDLSDQNTPPPGNIADVSGVTGVSPSSAVISPYGFRACNLPN